MALKWKVEKYEQLTRYVVSGERGVVTFGVTPIPDNLPFELQGKTIERLGNYLPTGLEFFSLDPIGDHYVLSGSAYFNEKCYFRADYAIAFVLLCEFLEKGEAVLREALERLYRQVIQRDIDIRREALGL